MKTKKCQDCKDSDVSDNQSESTTSTNQEKAFLALPGHPCIMIYDPEDVSYFNFTTGEGTGIWKGWAIMDGQIHTDINENRAITTLNMMDRAVVGAGNDYNIGDTFGADTHALTSGEMPSHTHVVTDPGHTHTVTDPGHTHTLTDPGHTHTLTDPGHSHGVTNTLALNAHVISHVVTEVNVTAGAGPDVPDTWDNYTDSLTGSISINTNSTGISMGTSSTGATIGSHSTGITNQTGSTGITIGSTGSGTAHENRQRSIAVLFVTRIYVA